MTPEDVLVFLDEHPELWDEALRILREIHAKKSSSS